MLAHKSLLKWPTEYPRIFLSFKASRLDLDITTFSTSSARSAELYSTTILIFD